MKSNGKFFVLTAVICFAGLILPLLGLEQQRRQANGEQEWLQSKAVLEDTDYLEEQIGELEQAASEAKKDTAAEQKAAAEQKEISAAQDREQHWVLENEPVLEFTGSDAVDWVEIVEVKEQLNMIREPGNDKIPMEEADHISRELLRKLSVSEVFTNMQVDQLYIDSAVFYSNDSGDLGKWVIRYLYDDGYVLSADASSQELFHSAEIVLDGDTGLVLELNYSGYRLMADQEPVESIEFPVEDIFGENILGLYASGIIGSEMEAEGDSDETGHRVVWVYQLAGELTLTWEYQLINGTASLTPLEDVAEGEAGDVQFQIGENEEVIREGDPFIFIYEAKLELKSLAQ